jgi:ribosomal protein S12 methylthiotransferase accessory factor
MVHGVDADSLSERTGAELPGARALLDRLASEGALREERPGRPPSRGVPLAEAILGAYRNGAMGTVAWTAEEALVMPAGLDPRARRRALRAFVSGLDPHPRLAAYSYVARWRTVSAWGDVPDGARLDAYLATAPDPDALHALSLVDGSCESVPVEDLAHLGGERAHRLGPVVRLRLDRRQIAERRHLFVCTARYASPNLRHPGRRHGFATGTAGSADEAELIARAEAVERYVAGDAGRRPLVRATESELANVVRPGWLFQLNDRQYADSDELERYDPAGSYLWTPASALDGSRRWLVAETVFYPFDDPDRGKRLPPASSSGVAAHSSWSEARERAFAELVERDAFMWTWVQRVARERIEKATLPTELLDRVREVEESGYEIELVNLTLDTKPIVLCALHNDGHLSIGAACHEDPARAAAKCLQEAGAVLWLPRHRSREAIEVRDVRTPRDHLQLHEHGDLLEHDRFLFSSPDSIDIREIKGRPGPIESAIAGIGEPILVDLTSPASRPFSVVRALVPNMIPISFGFDREPLGTRRLAEPKTTVDGHRVGRTLALDDAGPILPHPFP